MKNRPKYFCPGDVFHSSKPGGRKMDANSNQLSARCAGMARQMFRANRRNRSINGSYAFLRRLAGNDADAEDLLRNAHSSESRRRCRRSPGDPRSTHGFTASPIAFIWIGDARITGPNRVPMNGGPRVIAEFAAGPHGRAGGFGRVCFCLGGEARSGNPSRSSPALLSGSLTPGDRRSHGHRARHGQIPVAPGGGRTPAQPRGRPGRNHAHSGSQTHMNTLTESQIEEILRTAPSPMPPDGLKGRLLAETAKYAAQPRSAEQPPGPNETGRKPGIPSPRPNWLRRWWPVLIPAAGCLACAAILTAQQVQINHLKKAIQSLSTPTIAPKTVPQLNEVAPASEESDSNAQDEEVQRLKKEAGQLRSEINRLETIGNSNQQLRAQLAATPDSFTPQEINAVEQVAAKAMSIQCVNNLKQLGLAARMWADDHNNIYPTNVQQTATYLKTPSVLVCPADTAREAATNWASFTSANCSYQYMAPGGSYRDVQRVLFICLRSRDCLSVRRQRSNGRLQNASRLVRQARWEIVFRAAG